VSPRPETRDSFHVPRAQHPRRSPAHGTCKQAFDPLPISSDPGRRESDSRPSPPPPPPPPPPSPPPPPPPHPPPPPPPPQDRVSYTREARGTCYTGSMEEFISVYGAPPHTRKDGLGSPAKAPRSVGRPIGRRPRKEAGNRCHDFFRRKEVTRTSSPAPGTSLSDSHEKLFRTRRNSHVSFAGRRRV